MDQFTFHGSTATNASGEPIGTVTSFEITMVPARGGEDDYPSCETLSLGDVTVSGSFSMSMPRRQYKRLVYTLGGAPSWQYPDCM